MLDTIKKLLLPLIATFLCSFSAAEGSTLQPQTKEAYSRYIKDAENELILRAEGRLPFCQAFDSPANLVRISRGQTVIINLNQNDDTPEGIIHDWIGTRLIPGVTLDKVINILTDYDSHKDIFGDVIDSRIVNRSGNSMDVFLRLKKKKVITVISDTYHKVMLCSITSHKAQLFSQSTKINEVENYGEKNEKILPEGEDHGFLWGMNIYWSLEEIEEGVIVQCRSITLSREVPFGLNLIINPIINKIPRETLKSLLETLGIRLTVHDYSTLND